MRLRPQVLPRQLPQVLQERRVQLVQPVLREPLRVQRELQARPGVRPEVQRAQPVPR